jgi:hypothetical protein
MQIPLECSWLWLTKCDAKWTPVPQILGANKRNPETPKRRLHNQILLYKYTEQLFSAFKTSEYRKYIYSVLHTTCIPYCYRKVLHIAYAKHFAPKQNTETWLKIFPLINMNDTVRHRNKRYNNLQFSLPLPFPTFPHISSQTTASHVLSTIICTFRQLLKHLKSINAEMNACRFAIHPLTGILQNSMHYSYYTTPPHIILNACIVTCSFQSIMCCMEFNRAMCRRRQLSERELVVCERH